MRLISHPSLRLSSCDFPALDQLFTALLMKPHPATPQTGFDQLKPSLTCKLHTISLAVGRGLDQYERPWSALVGPWTTSSSRIAGSMNGSPAVRSVPLHANSIFSRIFRRRPHARLGRPLPRAGTKVPSMKQSPVTHCCVMRAYHLQFPDPTTRTR